MNITENSTQFRTLKLGPGFLLWCSISVIEVVIGGLLYTTFFAVFITQGRVRVGSGLLIGHLVLLNFLVCTFYQLGQTMVTYVAQIYVVNGLFCRNFEFLMVLTHFSANLSSLLLAVNRAIAIFIPHSYHRCTKPPVLCFFIGLPWFIALVLSLLPYFGVGGSFGVVKPFGACGISPGPPKFIYLMGSTIGIHFPILSVLLTYVVVFGKRIITTVKFRTHPTGETPAGRSEARSMERRTAVARVLFGSAIWDCVCVMPTSIVIQWWPREYYDSPYIQLWLRTLFFTAYVPYPVRLRVRDADFTFLDRTSAPSH